MRKITEIMSECFRHGRDKSLSNTVVEYDYKWRITRMFLHGNQIATLYDDGTLELDTCGWKTNTTKERMNGILKEFDLGYIFQKNFEWYYMNKKGVGVPVDRKLVLSIYGQ